MKKLIDCKAETLFRGTVFRCIGKYPFENIVDFMLVEYPDDMSSGYAIYCISGYHAGCVEVVLPLKAVSQYNRGISVKWLMENWNEWVYPDCPIINVEIFEPIVHNMIDISNK